MFTVAVVIGCAALVGITVVVWRPDEDLDPENFRELFERRSDMKRELPRAEIRHEHGLVNALTIAIVLVFAGLMLLIFWPPGMGLDGY